MSSPVRRRVALIVIAPLLLSACVAKTIADVAIAPVRAGGQVVDWTTTSRSEADRNRGRALRHREERLRRLDCSYRDSRAACERGDRPACDRAGEQYARIQDLAAAVRPEAR